MYNTPFTTHTPLILNALTIDVEDYFQVQAFASVSDYERWDHFECRVERNTDRILGILDNVSANTQTPAAMSSTKATFFILGWIAERYPNLVRRIKAAGHEIACHGYAHKVIYEQTKAEFREDIKRAKAILENITGDEIVGYRAPSYSITKETLWSLEILQQEGFRYDSSIFPIHHDIYGIPDAPRFPFVVSFDGNGPTFLSCKACNFRQSTILEFPISTIHISKLNLPVAGGGYFRLFPYSLIKKGLRHINNIEKQPFIFYLHPWEFDPRQPKIPGAGPRSQFRHRINLGKTEGRFQRLLKDFHFTTVDDILSRDS